MALTDPDRLFPIEPAARNVARELYDSIADLPIISPHGHTDPSWFAQNNYFVDPAQLFVVPDHYVFRMLVSQGVKLTDLGVPFADGAVEENDPRKIWDLFAKNYHLFRGTPSQMWLDHSFEHVFGIDEVLSQDTAESYYQHIDAKLKEDAFRPRQLYDRFGIEAIATTESALDDLKWHKQINDSDWNGRVVTTYRPDATVDPEFEGFSDNVSQLGELTEQDATHWQGYLKAHQIRRAYFKQMGATATDHGHASARTENLDPNSAEELFEKVLSGQFSSEEADQFRGQMLTEMARMSLDDGLVMQIHCGSYRNHSAVVFKHHGRDKGFDIPTATNYVDALKPMLDAVGMEPDLTIIIFTLDETSYSRELAPLAGAYPALKLGPAWWFFDSYEGMKRYREAVTETCGFYNTVGFNDDTRAFCSIPARHDVARRSDCAYLANLVLTGRLRKQDAFELAYDLTYRLAKEAYRL
jgi:glucuronate isomerase